MMIGEFVKKYKLYILAGVLLIVTIVAFFILWKRSTDQANQPQVLPINSPFEYSRNSINFSNTTEGTDIPSSLMVYKVTSPDKTVAENFAKRFTSATPTSSDTGMLWIFSDSVIIYSSQTYILNLESQKGLVTDVKINTADDIESFFLEYLNLREIKIEKVEPQTDARKEYSGYFVKDNLSYGSLSINGYAFKILADSSKIYSMEVLLMDPSHLLTYQEMPTRSLNQAIYQNHEFYLTYTNYDAAFEEKHPVIQATSKLSSLEISETSWKYIFIDSAYGYLIPAYQIVGNGELRDAQNNKYWADTVVYMCALNSQYIERVEPYIETNTLLDSGE